MLQINFFKGVFVIKEIAFLFVYLVFGFFVFHLLIVTFEGCVSPLLMNVYYSGNTQYPIGLIPCSLGLNRYQEIVDEAQIFVQQ